jgi:hypothetical protein
VLLVLTSLVLLLSLHSGLEYARANRTLYLFSTSFIEDIPRRLVGAGRFRFIIQPLVATFLGLRDARRDTRAGRPRFLTAVLFHKNLRGELARSSLLTLANLLLMGILLDSICQWLILGDSYLGAALVVGPVLIMAPYSMARTLANQH